MIYLSDHGVLQKKFMKLDKKREKKNDRKLYSKT